jgi:hypothetical protein
VLLEVNEQVQADRLCDNGGHRAQRSYSLHYNNLRMKLKGQIRQASCVTFRECEDLRFEVLPRSQGTTLSWVYPGSTFARLLPVLMST